MYSLILKGEEAAAFKEKVKVMMQKRNISIEELARRTGYSVDTLQDFFRRGKWNRFLADSIADELEIEFLKESR